MVIFFLLSSFFYFFLYDTATSDIYTLSLHDALPILTPTSITLPTVPNRFGRPMPTPGAAALFNVAQHIANRISKKYRSEEHTSELQSRRDLVCRLLLEKKKIMKVPLIIDRTISILLP